MGHPFGRPGRLGLRTFEVAEGSMRPTLEPGDYLLAVRGVPVRRGDLVVFPHPRRRQFWMVKRVTALAGEAASGSFAPVPEGHVYVMSDDPAVTTADSRTLGPIPLEGVYRVVLRYKPRITFRFRR